MLDSEFSGEQQGAFQETGRRYKKARIKPLTAEQREILQEQQQLYLLERMDLEREINDYSAAVASLRQELRGLIVKFEPALGNGPLASWSSQNGYLKKKDELEIKIKEQRDFGLGVGLELLLLKVPSARGAEYIHQECSLRTGILQGRKVQESRDGREAPDADSYYCLFCEKRY